MTVRRQLAISAAILTGGALFGAALVMSRGVPPRPVESSLAPFVEVVSVDRGDIAMTVHSRGTVKASQSTVLVAQVGGAVTHIDPRFSDGAFVGEGDTLATIDPRDYRFAVIEARAILASAETRFALEQVESRLAREEHGEGTGLAQRGPQQAEAQAALSAAQAALARAELALERTVIVAPFDGRVVRRDVNTGQVVQPGVALGALHATDWLEVRLPIEDGELAFLDLDPSGTGAIPVDFEAIFGGERHRWPGKVVRMAGALDPRTRMAYLIGRLPGGTAAPEVGLFVEARISGRTLESVVALPRSAIRGASRVWLVDDEDRLRSREVEVLRREEDRVVVGDGVSDGDRICVTPLDMAVEGMAVRLLEAGS